VYQKFSVFYLYIKVLITFDIKTSDLLTIQNPYIIFAAAKKFFNLIKTYETNT